MLDLVYLATGVAVLALFGVYAALLRRIAAASPMTCWRNWSPAPTAPALILTELGVGYRWMG